MVQITAVTALGVIVQALPKFLSSYATDIVDKLCQIVGGDDKERVQLASEAAHTREKVATLVPPRTLVPVYTKVYPRLCPLGKGSLLALLEMLRHTVSSLTQEDTRSLAPHLSDLFTTCLDHRAQQKMASMEDVEVVEEKCVQAFTELVVHLSEALFRPMFLKLLDWATHRGADEDRLIAFYHVADGVAGKLKGLFLLFAGYLVKSAASHLERTNCQDHVETNTGKGDPLFQKDPLRAEKTCCLLSHLLCCLHKCFLHNQTSPTSSFLTRDRFDTLMPPLVHQVSNMTGGEEAFQCRVESHLCPCVAQLAVAAGKEDMWKPLNHQLLLKTRHKTAEVRYAAVIVLKEVYTKLGSEFMSLLPETVPFLAELLEGLYTKYLGWWGILMCVLYM
jgi:U3 small nucleolar RNA-associated protein 10